MIKLFDIESICFLNIMSLTWALIETSLVLFIWIDFFSWIVQCSSLLFCITNNIINIAIVN